MRNGRAFRRGNVDLHIHTSASDGSLSPKQNVHLAMKKSLKVIGIADHDSISGIQASIAAAQTLSSHGKHRKKHGKKIIIVPAVEMSCSYYKEELHVLGYFINHHDKQLKKLLLARQKNRFRRAEKLLSAVNKQLISEGKTPISFMKVVKRAKGSLGKPHIAAELIAAGHVADMDQAFNEYLNKPAPHRVHVSKAIQIIKNTGGIPVIAHPYISLKSIKKNLKEHHALLRQLKKKGIEGVEAYTTAHTSKEERFYVRAAKKLGMLVTGGSDSHGPGTSCDFLGKFGVKMKCYDLLLKRKMELDSKKCID